ncbi:hypothetical protein GCM10009838_63280 [Catenulispora subtropica]|uniref:Uncharacterized protein n=1 Tax=Catenulispora subtropica TaxID=450798 RepID=A0ABN2SRA0_9ACTN
MNHMIQRKNQKIIQNALSRGWDMVTAPLFGADAKRGVRGAPGGSGIRGTAGADVRG